MSICFFVYRVRQRKKLRTAVLDQQKYVKSLTNIDKKNKDKDFRKRLSIVGFIHFKS